jgi:hypothetical protein
VGEPKDGELDSWIEMQAREQPTPEETAKPTRYPEGGDDENTGGDERGDGDGARLGVDDRVREDASEHTREPAQLVGHLHRFCSWWLLRRSQPTILGRSHKARAELPVTQARMPAAARPAPRLL